MPGMPGELAFAAVPAVGKPMSRASARRLRGFTSVGLPSEPVSNLSGGAARLRRGSSSPIGQAERRQSMIGAVLSNAVHTRTAERNLVNAWMIRGFL